MGYGSSWGGGGGAGDGSEGAGDGYDRYMLSMRYHEGYCWRDALGSIGERLEQNTHKKARL